MLSCFHHCFWVGHCLPCDFSCLPTQVPNWQISTRPCRTRASKSSPIPPKPPRMPPIELRGFSPSLIFFPPVPLFLRTRPAGSFPPHMGLARARSIGRATAPLDPPATWDDGGPLAEDVIRPRRASPLPSRPCFAGRSPCSPPPRKIKVPHSFFDKIILASGLLAKENECGKLVPCKGAK